MEDLLIDEIKDWRMFEDLVTAYFKEIQTIKESNKEG